MNEYTKIFTNYFFREKIFQVRSLYDGLSHLYTDCDSRLRHIPSTNYADKKRKDESTGKKSIHSPLAAFNTIFQSRSQMSI